MVNGRFLVIGDNSNDLATFKELLNQLSASVLHLENISNTNAIKEYNPDFIFLSLAGNNSVEGLITLKQLFNFLPIVVLTNESGGPITQSALEHGACEVVNIITTNLQELKSIIGIAQSRSKYINRLEERARNFESVKENSINAIFLTMQDGTILEANKGAEQMFGYTLTELRKIGRQGILDHSDPKLIQVLNTRAKEGKVRGEVIGIKKNGEHFPCEFSSVIFYNSAGQERVSTIILDISDKKRPRKKRIF